VARFEVDVQDIDKHLPLPGHTAAVPAAHAAWAAHQQGKFWEMHDFLFQSNGNAEASFAQAARFCLDVARYEPDRNGAKAKEAVDDDLRAGKLLGVRGTPAFFVNGHPYTGLRTRAQWVEIIEAELGEAKDLVSAGTPRAGVYDRLMEGAQTKKRTSLA